LRELSETYPDRKLYAVDTLCASMGQGLLVWYAAKMKQNGADIDAVRDFVENNKLNLCHCFTVDDLFFLKRGGRVSAATAVVGTMLSIKPVMHVDNEGRLIKVGTARGRKASINALFDKMKATVLPTGNSVIFISHGDCIEDAQYLADRVRNELGYEHIEINFVGPVIGAHSGPGTLALFFLGNER
jgi:DegV family protein with EDD domain